MNQREERERNEDAFVHAPECHAEPAEEARDALRSQCLFQAVPRARVQVRLRLQPAQCVTHTHTAHLVLRRAVSRLHLRSSTGVLTTAARQPEAVPVARMTPRSKSCRLERLSINFICPYDENTNAFSSMQPTNGELSPCRVINQDITCVRIFEHTR